MTTVLECKDVAGMLREGACLLKSNRDLLSQLDSATGDGDHGTTMGRVADAILESVESGGASSPQALLESTGWSVLSVDGGSASPLVGSFLLGMSEGCPPADQLTGADLAVAFESGLAKFRAQTPAQVGDKTMLDALVPAITALRAAADQGLSAAEILAKAAEAAKQGAESTKSLQAKFGRARNLGPRSVGFADPGATSVSLLVAGFQAAFAVSK
ncbi:MAG: dihydroxyacetone kinase subunit DhaL [Bryobacteraceae bacterium]